MSGAPPKQNIGDYYSHYIGMTKDQKLFKPRKKHGSVAVDVWLALLDIIYRDKGYYACYDQHSRELVTWQIQEYTKGKDAPTPEEIEEIIDDLVTAQLFHNPLFERGYLTSKRIQVQYYLSTVKRRSLVVNHDLWLLTPDEMRSLSTRSPLLAAVENLTQTNNCRQNGGKNPHNESKENQRKPKEIEVNERKSSALTDEQFQHLVKEYGESAVLAAKVRFAEWKAEKSVTNANEFKSIAKILSEDFSKTPPPEKSTPSFDISKFEELSLRKYKNNIS